MPAPSAIFHFESAHPLFPIGLERSEIPTVCFHPHSYAFTKRRIRWSAVFDHAAVFHPGYGERFRRAGHPGAFLLPHAVRKDLLAGADPLREFEIAWVGQTSGEFYKNRAEWLPKLAREFHSNDWSRPYTVEEAAKRLSPFADRGEYRPGPYRSAVQKRSRARLSPIRV